MSKTPVGEVRPSQLLWTYGPGALIDLPNLSVVTMGIDRWELGRCQPIQEARLLANVRRVLGDQVESLRMPPLTDSDVVDPFSAEALVGVPVKPFPRWMRCVKCGLLSPFDAGLFELKANRYRPERTCFVHKGCTGSRGDQKPRDADAVPARFLLACREGHLDDFPWHWFVHGGPSGCKGTLRFFESGASLQTENLWVRCDSCSAAKSMAQAFGQAGKDNLPGCRGRHPHLNRFEDGCAEVPRAILLGATNGWFPVTLSVLAIPQTGSPLAQLVADGWTFFEDVESAVEAAAVVKTLKKSAQLPGIDAFTGDQVWEAIEAHRGGTVGDEDLDLKGPEWDVLTSPTPPTDYPHFMSKKADVPKGFEKYISRVLLLERLREVNALLGFTRVESPNEGGWRGACAPRTDRPYGAQLGTGHAGPRRGHLPAVLRGGARRLGEVAWCVEAGGRAAQRPSRLACAPWARARSRLPGNALRAAPHHRASAHPRARARLRLQRSEHPRARLCRHRRRKVAGGHLDLHGGGRLRRHARRTRRPRQDPRISGACCGRRSIARRSAPPIRSVPSTIRGRTRRSTPPRVTRARSSPRLHASAATAISIEPSSSRRSKSTDAAFFAGI